MQRLSEFLASPDWMTAQAVERRYADAEANGVVIGTPENPYPGMSPEELAEMDEFKAGLIREREAARAKAYWRLNEGEALSYSDPGVALRLIIEHLRRMPGVES